MQLEPNALETNETWEVNSLSRGKKTIDSKWVYKINFQLNAMIERLKARLVARGDKQEAGKHYKHTLSPWVSLFQLEY